MLSDHSGQLIPFNNLAKKSEDAINILAINRQRKGPVALKSFQANVFCS